MSKYLGFNPINNPFYFFLSYNSEDCDRIKNVARIMIHSGINLWYDYGIDYGDRWEQVITEKIRDSQGLILFFTKGILSKTDSYVQKEYKIAKFLKRKTYVVFIDQIYDNDIPMDKVTWWIDILDNQTVNLFESENVNSIIETLSNLLGVQSHEDKMDKMISAYNSLYFEGRLQEAGMLLSEYLHSVSMQGKAQIIANLCMGGFPGTIVMPSGKKMTHQNIQELEYPLLIFGNKKAEELYECRKIMVHDDLFIVGNQWLGYRSGGDPHVICIWKNGELIHTFGALIEADNLDVYWDTLENILYVKIQSYKITSIDGKDTMHTWISIIVVEDPNNLAVCQNYKYILDMDIYHKA